MHELGTSWNGVSRWCLCWHGWFAVPGDRRQPRFGVHHSESRLRSNSADRALPGMDTRAMKPLDSADSSFSIVISIHSVHSALAELQVHWNSALWCFVGHFSCNLFGFDHWCCISKLQETLSEALFPINLLLVLTTGGQLFTGNSATMAIGIYEKKCTTKDCFLRMGTRLQLWNREERLASYTRVAHTDLLVQLEYCAHKGTRVPQASLKRKLYFRVLSSLSFKHLRQKKNERTWSAIGPLPTSATFVAACWSMPFGPTELICGFSRSNRVIWASWILREILCPQ